MASDSLKSMYKVKIREGNTISTRRMSRGLERKKYRDDEVNKRRLLSDEMSPVLEDNSNSNDDSYHEDKPNRPIVHEKVSTRLERLKQWREEKKRKTEQQKKESKKPVFKVSPLKHIGESSLYKRTQTKEINQVRRLETTDGNKMSDSAKVMKLSNSSKQQIKDTSSQTGIHKSALDSVVTADRKSTKRLPGKKTVAKASQSVVAQHDRMVKSTKRQPVKETAVQTGQHENLKSSTRNGGSNGKMNVHQKEKRTDLASKLTVSAAAKAKTNLDKPKEFLRANWRVTKATEQNKQVDYKKQKDSKKNEKQENAQPCEEVEAVKESDYMGLVCSTEPEHSESSSDSKELHLSDSAVSTPKHSTPAPRRSVRGKNASNMKKKNVNVNNCNTTPSNMNEEPAHSSGRHVVQERSNKQIKEEASVDLGPALSQDIVHGERLRTLSAEMINDTEERASNTEHVSKPGCTEHVETSMDHIEHVSKPGCTEHVETSMDHIEHVHISVEHTVDNLLVVSNKENVACLQGKSILLPVTDGTTLRRQSQLLNVVDKQMGADDKDDVCVPATARRKKSQRYSQSLASIDNVEINSVLVDSSAPGSAKRPRRSVARSCVEVDACTSIIKTGDSNTQLPVDGTTVPKSNPKHVNSSLSKRRSVRIASQAFSNLASSDSEDEIATTKYRKTPAVRRRQSTRTHLSPEESVRSTFVSVSHEGTSHLIGDNIVDKMDIAATPRHIQHKTVSCKSVRQRTVVRTSDVIIDISNEGTALSGDGPSIVYEVRKPVEAEASLRALQELAVQKLEGETSFIEVPLDESVDGDLAVNTVSLSVSSITAASEDDVVEMSSVATVTGEDNQSTQPFTPRSNEMTMSVHSSAISKTPDRNGEISVTPRSSRSRGLPVSGLPSFKTPGQPTSTVRSKNPSKRRKTEMSTPLKSPEEMIEILKKSPMIELTRRRSRHVRLSGPAGVHQLMSESVGSPGVSIEKSEDTEVTTCQVPAVGDGSQLDVGVSGVQHFRELLLSERVRLQQLCDTWSQVSTSTLNLQEEVLGQIRSTIGKAQLLMDQRFQQFSALVDNCQLGLGEKKTTLTDLQGFWEMIYFQVEDVNKLFTSLTELQHNNWHVKQPSPARDVGRKRKVVKISKPKIKSNFAAFREEIIKRKAQAAVKPSTVSSDETLEATKVFDAGFFKVTSPVRSSSGRKSQQHNSPLKPAANSTVLTSSSGQDNLSQGSSKDQTSTPVNLGNKENKVSNTPSSRFVPLSAKRLSYLPAVPSPLLNDITGLLTKKS